MKIKANKEYEIKRRGSGSVFEDYRYPVLLISYEAGRQARHGVSFVDDGVPINFEVEWEEKDCEGGFSRDLQRATLNDYTDI